MVVFTCNHCGDSLQKPRVAKHYDTTCSRNPKSLTCVDCFKDFRLEEYNAHTKCMTEDQRYSAKGTTFKEQKGELKQNAWINTINTIVEEQKNVKPGVKRVLEMLQKHSNIPRKKAKFINFLRSASGNKISQNDVEEVWNLIESNKKSQQNTVVNGNTNTDISKSNEKKIEEEKNSQENDVDGKKKKKKFHEKTETTNGTTAQEEVQQNGSAESEIKAEKKKKKKSKQNADNTPENDAGNVGDDDKNVTKKKRKISETEKNSDEKKKKDSEQINVQNNENPKEITSKKKNKKKLEENNNKEDEEEPSAKKKKLDGNESKSDEIFLFKDVILDILKKKSKGISKDALQKKVLKKYVELQGPIDNEQKLLKKYNKKLRAIKNVVCENETYKLME